MPEGVLVDEPYAAQPDATSQVAKYLPGTKKGRVNQLATCARNTNYGSGGRREFAMNVRIAGQTGGSD